MIAIEWMDHGTPVAQAARVLRRLQARLVHDIKRRALIRTTRSPRSETWLLAEYLWGEECAEGAALAKAIAGTGPAWLGKLLERQLADEARHAELLRARLAELGWRGSVRARGGAVVRGKLWLLEQIGSRAARDFSGGEVVPLLACAASLEATGARVFGRHLAVLEAKEEERGRLEPTAHVLRTILADERRHVSGCEGALRKLVTAAEAPALARLRARIAAVDRALGVTSSIALWGVVAGLEMHDRRRGTAAIAAGPAATAARPSDRVRRAA